MEICLFIAQKNNVCYYDFDSKKEGFYMSKKKIKIIAIMSVIVVLVIAAVILTTNVLVPYIQHKRAVKAMSEYYDNKITLYEQENKDADEIDVVFLGDSLTDGCDLKKYYPDYVTLNRGIGGDTTRGLLERLEVSVYDVKPKVCVMLIGGNNIDTMFNDYENILKGFEKNIPDTKIILVSLTAMGGDFKEKNYIAAYNNIKIKELAEKYGYSYVDVFSPLLNQQTDEIYSQYTIDGVHFSDKGYEVVTKAINEEIKKILK